MVIQVTDIVTPKIKIKIEKEKEKGSAWHFLLFTAIISEMVNYCFIMMKNYRIYYSLF